MAELTIVMAITAIVAAMVVTSVVIFTNQHNEIRRQAAIVSDISTINQTVTDWLRIYDKSNYDITVDNTGKILRASINNESQSMLTLNSSTKKIMVDNVAKSTKLKSVTSIMFLRRTGENVIKISVSYGENNDVQVLLVPVFTQITRERSVTGR